MDEPLFDEEVEGPVDLHRRRPTRIPFEPIHDLVGAEGHMLRQQNLENGSAPRCQPGAAIAARPFRLVEAGGDTSAMVMLGRWKIGDFGVHEDLRGGDATV